MAAIHVQRCLKPAPLPVFLIVDISWALEVEPSLNWFVQCFPIQDIIACFTKIDVYVDCNEVIWNELDRRLLDCMDDYDFMQVDFFIQVLMETFYQRLEYIMPHYSDQYRYHGWLDEASLVMIHKDYENQFGSYVPRLGLRRPPW